MLNNYLIIQDNIAKFISWQEHPVTKDRIKRTVCCTMSGDSADKFIESILKDLILQGRIKVCLSVEGEKLYSPLVEKPVAI